MIVPVRPADEVGRGLKRSSNWRSKWASIVRPADEVGRGLKRDFD
jgi:hypothetical protein